MQVDVAQEIFEIVKILPEDKQRVVLRQAESLANGEKNQTIWQKIRARAQKVPAEVWDKIPSDSADNHDHYLYGTPKK